MSDLSSHLQLFLRLKWSKKKNQQMAIYDEEVNAEAQMVFFSSLMKKEK